jgi:regulation of enolase protein 1 (concanavalin A-like superfamily)
VTYGRYGPFVDVPQEQWGTPPAGAKSLSAAALNHIEDGIAAASSLPEDDQAREQYTPSRLSEASLLATHGARFRSPTPRPFGAPTAIVSPTIAVMGVDPANHRVFGSNRTNGPFAQSDDDGVTWTNRFGPDGVTSTSVQKFAVFGAYVYVMVTHGTTGLVGIYRARNSAKNTTDWDTANWSGALVTLPTGVEGKSTTFNAGSQYLFLGEYEADGVDIAALGGPQLLRSADGVTWETVWGRDAATKHIHGVYEDPYNPGHVYMTVGDNTTPVSVYRSTSHGAAGTWTPIITGGDNDWQAVQISFSPDWVWLAADRRGFAVAVFNRDELVPYVAASNLPRMMAVPGAPVTTDRFYEIGYYGAVDPATGVFYLNQSDTSTAGNTFGNFYLPQLGGRLELLDFGKSPYTGNGEVYVANGQVYVGNLRFPTFRPAPA